MSQLVRPSSEGEEELRASSHSDTPTGGTPTSRSVWGLLDQTLLSGTNFLTMLVLARQLEPSAFGAFVVVYTLLLLLYSVQLALITQPHNVLGVTARHDYRTYTSSTAAVQAVLAGSLGLLVLVIAVVPPARGTVAAPLLVALAAAIVAWQAQEFLRRVFYTEGRFAAALCNDLLSYGGQLLALGLLLGSGRLTGPNALYALAGTSALAALVAAFQLRRSFAGRARLDHVRENWRFGRWLGATSGAFWISTYLVLYLSTFIVGAVAPAALRAAQLVLGPLNVLLLFISTVAPIGLARAFADSGTPALRASLHRTSRFTAPFVLVYCVLAAVFAEPLMTLFYGDTYEDYSIVLVLTAAYYLLVYVAELLTAALKATRRTRQVFTAQAGSAASVVVTAPPLILVWGVEGAALALVVGMGITVMALTWSYLRTPRSTGTMPPSEEPEAA